MLTLFGFNFRLNFLLNRLHMITLTFDIEYAPVIGRCFYCLNLDIFNFITILFGLINWLITNILTALY